MDNENLNLNANAENTGNIDSTTQPGMAPLADNTASTAVENTSSVEAPVKPDETAVPNLNPTTTEGVIKLEKWINERAKASETENPMAEPPKVLLINEKNPDKMYALRVHFPGTTVAARMQTETLQENGGFDLVKFMQLAVSEGVIITPKIGDVDDFFNVHKGTFAEAADKVFNFLNDGLSD